MDSICYLCGADPAPGSICGACGFNFSQDELDEDKDIDEMSRRVEMRIESSKELLQRVDFEPRPNQAIPEVEDLINVQAEE